MLRGVEMGYMLQPVHCVYIQSELVTGYFLVSVCLELPVRGIGLLMGNNIAGGKVTPSLEVLNSPQRAKPGQVKHKTPGQYLACVVTCTQALKKLQAMAADTDVSLCDSVIMSAFSDQAEMGPTDGMRSGKAATPVGVGPDAPVGDRSSLPVSRAWLCEAQRADPTLKGCFTKVVSNSNATDQQVAYYLEDNLLMHRWSPSVADDAEWSAICQIVVPAEY